MYCYLTFTIELSSNILWLSHSGAIYHIPYTIYHTLVLSLTESPLNKVRGCVAFCFLWSIYHITIQSFQIPQSLPIVYFRGVFHIGICLFCVLFFLESLPECTADALFTIANEPEFEPWSKPLHKNKMYLSCDIKPTNNNNKIKYNEIKTQIYTQKKSLSDVILGGENWIFSKISLCYTHYIFLHECIHYYVAHTK